MQTSVPPLIEKSQVRAPSPVVDPAEAPGRERGAGRADRSQAREVAAAGGLDARLHAGVDVGGARAEARDPGALGELPEHVRCPAPPGSRRRERSRVGQEAADEEVPHHPAGGREPEEPVAGARVDVEPDLLQVLEEDAALPVDDRLRQAGRAGGVEDPERVIERKPLAGRAAPGRRNACQGSVPASFASGSR